MLRHKFIASGLASVLTASVLWTAAQAAPLTLSHTFDEPTNRIEGRFGYSVALSGNKVLVSGITNDDGSTRPEEVHLFDATTGVLLQTFANPSSTGVGQFGSSVALSGNNVLVGSWLDDTNGIFSGQAHLFDATTGALLRTFNDPTPTSADQFGSSVALSGDNVLIGAVGDDTNGDGVGQAHLFDATTGALLQTFNDPTPTGADQFGFSVALSGNNVLIAATGDDSGGLNFGQAHLFDATTGVLLQTFNNPTPTTVDSFGSSVAVSGNHALIGAHGDDTNGPFSGQAYLFDVVTGAVLQTFNDPTPTGNDSFGFSVALSGNNVLAGAINSDDNGANVGQAHLFDATTGALLQTFNDPTPTGADQFGFSVALSGNNVLIGARGDDTNGSNVGQAHLYTVADTSPAVPEPGMLTLFGMGLAGLGLMRRRARAVRG